MQFIRVSVKTKAHVKTIFCTTSEFYQIRIQQYSQPAFTCSKSRTMCEISSKLTIKTPERRQWRRSGVFIVNFDHISPLFLVLLFWTDNCLLGWVNRKNNLTFPFPFFYFFDELLLSLRGVVLPSFMFFLQFLQFFTILFLLLWPNQLLLLKK